MHFIEILTENEWDQVSNIYWEGIQTRKATFQTKLPTWNEWDQGHLSACRYVAKNEAGEVLGWCALSKVSSRCVYSGVAEVSVYVGKAHRGKSVGTLLLKHLIEQSELNGIWTLQSSIISENKESIRLHEKCGFRCVGTREKLGKMADERWMDVVLMERRSAVVGVK